MALLRILLSTAKGVAAKPLAPGSSTLYPTDDAFVRESFPDDTHNWTYMQFRTQTGEPLNRNNRPFLKFDLSPLPPGAVIQSATLRLYCYEAFNLVSGVTDLEARRISDDSWTETTLTWNNQPPYGAVEDTIEPAISAWNEWDITSFVQDEWAGDKVVSICIKCVQESYDGTERYGNFCAKEWDGADPQLVINYLA